MLCELKVANFAIIDNVHIQFRSGLNILSGETGAGKSILIKSLGLMMGEKASAESVRAGAETAVIEGSFDIASRPDLRERLNEMGIESSEDLMVVRRVVAKDKSRVYINGALSTLSALRELVAPLVEVAGHAVPLIEMTGQHENRNLLSRAYHLDLVDQYAGLWPKRIEFSENYRRLQALDAEIQAIQLESRTRAQRLDFLIYQRDEIKALDLQPGEEAEIENETKRLKHSARLGDFAAQAENLLYNDEGAVASRLHYLLQRASELKNIDPELVAKLEPLAQAKTLINEVSYDLRDYTKSLEADPSRLEELESRLSSLRHLQKKYGATATDILGTLVTIEDEISQLENSDELLADKQKEHDSLFQLLRSEAANLHQRRESAALLFGNGVNDELKDLNMKGVCFSIAINRSEELTATGTTSIEFMTQASKNDPPRPLAKFASGGELSRILLSIKQVVGQIVGAGQFPRTYLFDEVDSGVSGPTAEKVGRKLHSMSQGQQVICVTHLPQVAAHGDAHYFIHKVSAETKKAGAVHTEVTELRSAERIQEIARLISGEKITKTSLAHAEQLLKDLNA